METDKAPRASGRSVHADPIHKSAHLLVSNMNGTSGP